MAPRIVGIEWARLEGQRPRLAGANARLGDHGRTVQPPIARLTTDDGASGFGWSRVTREQAAALLGRTVTDAFDDERGVAADWRVLEYPLWDLAARRAACPVYHLAAAMAGVDLRPSPLAVPCYDTTLYFDDLHLRADGDAAALLAREARDGYERGHRAFKIKVGRGARHMPLEEGTRRDVAIIQAVRDAVGPEAALLIDANNGYNLNLAKRVLAETADRGIFWLEEPFHEDPVLYGDLKDWQAQQGLAVLIADGEGQAAPALLEWARNGLIDVVQYDIFAHGFGAWLATGRQLDAWGVRSAPHHYGGHYGNYAACHLAGAVRRFTYAEWDEATTPGLDTSRYTVRDGRVNVPDLPGFGLALDEAVYRTAVRNDGWELR